MTLEDATQLVDSKKTSQFGTTLLRPKKNQIHIQKNTSKIKVFGQNMSASFGRIMENLQTRIKMMPRHKMRAKRRNDQILQ